MRSSSSREARQCSAVDRIAASCILDSVSIEEYSAVLIFTSLYLAIRHSWLLHSIFSAEKLLCSCIRSQICCLGQTFNRQQIYWKLTMFDDDTMLICSSLWFILEFSLLINCCLLHSTSYLCILYIGLGLASKLAHVLHRQLSQIIKK